MRILNRQSKDTPNRSSRAERAVLLLCILFALGLLFTGWLQPAIRLRKAKALLLNHDPRGALSIFLSLDGRFDAKQGADDCYALIGEEALREDRPDAAFASLMMIRDREGESAERLRDALFAYANKQNSDVSIRIYATIIPDRPDSAPALAKLLLERGQTFLEENEYEQAYFDLSRIPASSPRVEDALLRCKDGYYDRALLSFAEQNEIPASFFHPMLDGHRDAEKYRTYYLLERDSWSEQSHDQNVEKLYALGDFLDASTSAFSFYRLSNRRYENASGYYLEMKPDGGIQSNLSSYRFFGYYGLYSKLADGIYSIGSDEAHWTKQFAFAFSELDNTLSVYCYRNGGTYVLQYRDSGSA